jgi:multiple sugar transport system permease protein
MTTQSTATGRTYDRVTARATKSALWPAVAYWARLIALVAITALFSLPTIWLVLTSLKPEVEYGSYPITILPVDTQWANYLTAVTFFPFFKHFKNSTILAGSFTALTVLSSSLAGFAFSRFRGVPGRNALFGIVLATFMVPYLVTLVPTFIVFAHFNLTNTYWPWILWGIGGSPFHIFLFRQFFSSIPKDLEDAAEVDGCGKFRTWWQIFMPNSLPAVAASTIFCFTWVWGDYLYPVLFLNDDITTLAVKMMTAYVNPNGYILYTLTMSGVVLYILPMIVIFFISQKYIIQGVVTTGLKG